MHASPTITKRALALATAPLLCLVATNAVAHYCSNIFSGPARLVVKPEVTTLHLSGTNPATLKVYLQNNFPYKLFALKMKGEATGYTVSATPAQQDVNPGQNVLYSLTVKSTGSGGDVDVSALNLQVMFRVGDWRDSSDELVEQSPSQSSLAGNAVYTQGNAQQSPSLSLALLFDKYPSATLASGAPTFSRTGVQQLVHMFGYRFCYDSDGTWACNADDCPSSCAEPGAWSSTEQFPQDCMRAGVELGVRTAKLGSQLQPARDAAANAMKDGSDLHKCLAAVVGGRLWQGASSTTPFESALSNVSAACKAAGLRALGKGTASSCGSGAYQERAACAAAEGLAGNDAPVTSILLPNAGDGESTSSSEWQRSLFYSYMLYLVTGDRYAQGKSPSYYPPVGPTPDKGVVQKDSGATQKDLGPHPDGWIPPEAGVGDAASGDARPRGDGAGGTLSGGCAVGGGAGERGGGVMLALLALVAWLRRRDLTRRT